MTKIIHTKCFTQLLNLSKPGVYGLEMDWYCHRCRHPVDAMDAALISTEIELYQADNAAELFHNPIPSTEL